MKKYLFFIFCASFLVVHQADGAFLFNNGGVKSNGSASATTASVGTTTMAANNLIVICVSHETNVTVSSVADSIGTTYTFATSTASGTSIFEEVWYGYNSVASSPASWSATSTFSAGATFRNIAFVAYSGFTSPVLDQVSVSNGLTGNTSVPSKTTTVANEVVHGCSANFSNSNNFTAGASYTQRTAMTASDSQGTEDQIVSATGAFTAPQTVSASTRWTDIMVTFYDNAVVVSVPKVKLFIRGFVRLLGFLKI